MEKVNKIKLPQETIDERAEYIPHKLFPFLK